MPEAPDSRADDSAPDSAPHRPALPAWLEPLRQRVGQMRGEDLSRFLPPEEPEPREGAVLVLFGDGPEGPDVLLTERAHDMRSQPGQVSFPGGSLDPGETAVEAALRETFEETGIDPAGIDVFAVLPRLWLPPRNFAVAPVLAYWREEAQTGSVNPAEVHDVHRVPIAHLLEPANRFSVKHPLGWAGPGWTIAEEVLLWGFTAGVLDALFDFVGWTRDWDRDRVEQLPDRHVDWPRVAQLMGIEVPEGEEFDPVAAGLVAEDVPEADELPPAAADRDHGRDQRGDR